MENRTGLIRPFDFSGRVNRLQYFISTVGLAALLWSWGDLAFEIWNYFEKPFLEIIFKTLSVSLIILCLVSLCSVTVRRFHDLGKRWFFLPLLVFFPYTLYLLAILYGRPGEPQSNEYGPPVNVKT